MATSLLLLLDDIASVLDDVALMTKAAVKKTAGVLGDDLALNAKQITGTPADRELPVVFKVATGSLANKGILVPAALMLNWFVPDVITPLLILGGAFLCFEGAEKVLHRFIHQGNSNHSDGSLPNQTKNTDLAQTEASRIRGAIRTDFILSAEIIVITLGVVADKPFFTQLSVLVAIALLMTVGVYGLVAGIVKLDDVGILLLQQPNSSGQMIGRAIIRVTPWIMRFLTVAGTAAMFLVGGGIVLHGIPTLHHAIEHEIKASAPNTVSLLMMLANGICGICTGVLVLTVVNATKTLRTKFMQ
jgi:predicted DNA repair protein MutK